MADDYTRWSVVGAGEAGCRIASHYFATHPTRAVQDRILLLNTAQADMTNLFEDLKDVVGTSEEARKRIEEARDRTLIFGDSAGAGNWYETGEELLVDPDNWREVKTEVDGTLGGLSDVIVHMCGLAGGTGNGAIPPLIHRLQEGEADAVPSDVYQFACGVWPYPDESRRHKVNALMGLSRLLRYGDEGGLNSDLVLLMGNREISEIASEHGVGTGQRFQDLNRVIVEVINALMSPGQKAQNVIDAQDYASAAELYEMPHFTAGIAWDIPEYFEVGAALDEALSNTLIPMDPSTSMSVYLVLQVPPDAMEKPAFSSEEVKRTFREWTEDRDIEAHTRMDSVVPNPNLSGTYHATLLFGGFDLTPLVGDYEDLVEKWIESKRKGFGDNSETVEEVESLWERLQEYVEVNNERRSIHQL